MKKTHSLRIHAKRQALRRYSLVLNRHDLRQIAQDIQANKSTHLRNISHRMSEHTVDVLGITCRVVYDRLRHVIVTFLPDLARKEAANEVVPLKTKKL